MTLFLATAPNDYSWLTTAVGGSLVAIIGGLIAWWNGRPKNTNDQFKLFMDESSEFREEIRKDRESLKLELKDAKVEVELLKLKITEYSKKIEACDALLFRCQIELANNKAQLELFVKKVRSLNSDTQKIILLDNSGAPIGVELPQIDI